MIVHATRVVFLQQRNRICPFKRKSYCYLNVFSIYLSLIITCTRKKVKTWWSVWSIWSNESEKKWEKLGLLNDIRLVEKEIDEQNKTKKKKILELKKIKGIFFPEKFLVIFSFFSYKVMFSLVGLEKPRKNP